MKIPAGAAYLPDYIDAPTETALECHVDASNWLGDLKRRVQHYGYRYDYKARRVTGESYIGPLPFWLLDLADRLVRDGIFSKTPDQVIVNEYLPGQGIAPHVDCEPCFGDIVASLSLGSTCLMEFRDTQSDEILVHTLEPRSLLILGGEARFDWKHGIPPRKSDIVGAVRTPRTRRLSLTFRTVIRAE